MSGHHCGKKPIAAVAARIVDVPFTELAAQNALVEACRLVGIAVESFALIRIGSNAVFRVNSDVIGRIAPDRSLLANAEKQVAVARWLREVNYPAVRALD